MKGPVRPADDAGLGPRPGSESRMGGGPRAKLMKPKSVLGGACLAMVVCLGTSGRAVGSEPPAESGAAVIRSDAEIESAIRSFGGDKSVTRPGREAIMGFSTPTTIKEIAIKGGQAVKKGDLLVRGDDGEQVAIYKFTKLQAETDLPVQKAQKT